MQLLSATTKDPRRTADDGRSPSACAGAVLEALPGIMWFVRRQMRSRRTAGMSVPQFRALVNIHRCPARSLFELAEKIGSSVPTVSRIVSGLVAHGLVDRQGCTADRRRIALRLTPRGETALEAAWSGTQDALAQRLAALPEADRMMLARSFALLHDVFGCSERGAGMACVEPEDAAACAGDAHAGPRPRSRRRNRA